MNDLEEVEPGDEGRTYREKSYWARLRVVLAGPAMNFASAFVLLHGGVHGLRRVQRQGLEGGLDRRRARPRPRPGCRRATSLISVDGQPVGDFDHVHRDDPAPRRPAGRPGGRSRRPAPHDPHAHASAGSSTRPARPSSTPSQAGDQIVSGQRGQRSTTTHQTRPAAGRRARRARPRSRSSATATPTRTTGSPAPVTPAGRRCHRLPRASRRCPAHERLGPVQAVDHLGRSRSDRSSTGRCRPLGHFFSPSGLSQLHPTRADQHGAARPPPPQRRSGAHRAGRARTRRHPSAQPGRRPWPRRTTTGCCRSSGVLRLGSQAAGPAGWPPCSCCSPLINIFLGLLNLVPLPPFDGGHAAVATYEAIRERLERAALPGRHGQAASPSPTRCWCCSASSS